MKRNKSKKRKEAIDLLGLSKMKLKRKPIPVTNFDSATGYISFDPGDIDFTVTYRNH